MPRSLRSAPGLLATLWLLVSVAASSSGVAAQDVELLGEVHGTRPPPGYFEQLDRDPDSFRFESEGLERMDRLLRLQEDVGLRPLFQIEGLERSPIGPREEAVVGEFRFPLVLGLFADSPELSPFSREEIQREFFDGPNSRYQTISELYDEMSGGQAELVGVTFDWVRTGLTREDVTVGSSGLTADTVRGVATFIEEVVAALDAEGVDWSEFDHTGDGFVDVLTVMHATPGAECNTKDEWPEEWKDRDERVWSHRWNVRNASGGRLNPGIETSTPRPGGEGQIQIRDYTIQPAFSCDGTSINEIGVFAHELGHAFGLPDLYSTGVSAHRGAGNWDLMGTGTWGCRGDSPERPCHMGAWSKAMLGWVDVEVVASDRDHGKIRVPPVISSRTVLEVRSGDGSREHLLLENRQRQGSDERLFESGLLVWQIDGDVVDGRWRSNSVNNDPERMGVRLRQADGSNALGEPGGGRGSPGDPFPGCARENHLDQSEPCGRNREFHAGSLPASRTHGGDPMGITLLEIDEVGALPHDVEFRLLTRFQNVSVRSEGVDSEQPAPVVTVDGGDPGGREHAFRSAPFQTHEIVASPGVEFAEGFRTPFLEWRDDAPRERTFTTGLRDTVLVARYGSTEVRVDLSLSSSADGVSPGEVILTPSSGGGWVPEGAEVAVEAKPRTGFSFREWKGALTDAGNPTSLVVNAPVSLEAVFDVVYGIPEVPGTVEMEAARPHELVLQVENANEPVRWSVVEGRLPEGLALLDEEGVIEGAPLDPGEFTFRVLARDAIGLEAEARITLRVGRPSIAEAELVGPFLATGLGPTSLQEAYLDRHGNANGRYDVGDLRAFLQEWAAAPIAAEAAEGEGASGTVEIVVPMGPVRDPGEGERPPPGREP